MENLHPTEKNSNNIELEQKCDELEQLLLLAHKKLHEIRELQKNVAHTSQDTPSTPTISSSEHQEVLTPRHPLVFGERALIVHGENGEDAFEVVSEDGMGAVVVADGASMVRVGSEVFEGYSGIFAEQMTQVSARGLKRQLTPGLTLEQAQEAVLQVIKKTAVSARENLEHCKQYIIKYPQSGSTSKYQPNSQSFPLNALPGMSTLLVGVYYEPIDNEPVWITSDFGDGFMFLVGPGRADGGSRLKGSSESPFLGQARADDCVVRIQQYVEGDKLVAATDGLENVLRNLIEKKFPTSLNGYFTEGLKTHGRNFAAFLKEATDVKGRRYFTKPPLMGMDDITFAIIDTDQKFKI